MRLAPACVLVQYVCLYSCVVVCMFAACAFACVVCERARWQVPVRCGLWALCTFARSTGGTAQRSAGTGEGSDPSTAACVRPVFPSPPHNTLIVKKSAQRNRENPTSFHRRDPTCDAVQRRSEPREPGPRTQPGPRGDPTDGEVHRSCPLSSGACRVPRTHPRPNPREPPNIAFTNRRRSPVGISAPLLVPPRAGEDASRAAHKPSGAPRLVPRRSS